MADSSRPERASLGAYTPSGRPKLGLSLAGGGFRASLFHVGVLTRMAELDLLRYVEVLSTVSGGSIVGALYTLLLKRALERPQTNGTLTQSQYVDVVSQLRETMQKAVRLNLRTRLLANPLTTLRVQLTGRTLAASMARLYERHIYRDVVDQLEKTKPGIRYRRGAIRLKDLDIKPGGRSVTGGLDAYNGAAVECKGSVITRLVLNATSLNSGARFWFSATELGEWFLGHFRHSEIEELMKRRRLLLGGQRPDPKGFAADPTSAIAAWWRDKDFRLDQVAYWQPLTAIPGFPWSIRTTALGLLRIAKVPAWYRLRGSHRTPAVTGGLSADDQWLAVSRAMREIEGEDWPAILSDLDSDEIRLRFLEFVLEVYWMRTAEVASDRLEHDWNTLTLGDAVGASAAFPPVFPPFTINGFYDDAVVSRLGLTDGGVYDNIGLTALLDEGCNYVIASDTSGLLGIAEKASVGRAGLVARAMSILMEDVAWRQRDQLELCYRLAIEVNDAVQRVPGLDRLKEFSDYRGLQGVASFHIRSAGVPRTSEFPYEPRAVAQIRTDLDAFGDLEIDALINRGYYIADRCIRKYLADTPYASAGWRAPDGAPAPLPAVDAPIDAVLRAARLRFGRPLVLLNIPAWLFVLAGSFLLFGGVIDWAAWLRRIPGPVRTAMFGPMTVLADVLLRPPVLFFIVILIVAIVAIRGRVSTVEELRRRGQYGFARGAARFARALRAYKANLGWLVCLAPAVLALAASLIALVELLVFTPLFLRDTRRDR